MRMRSEFEFELDGNMVQFVRTRDKNGKFRFVYPDCTNPIPLILHFSHNHHFMLAQIFQSIYGLFLSQLSSHLLCVSVF